MKDSIPPILALSLASVLVLLCAAGPVRAGWKDLIKKADELSGGVNKRAKGKASSQSSAAVRGAGEDEESAADDEEPAEPEPPPKPRAKKTAPKARQNAGSAARGGAGLDGEEPAAREEPAGEAPAAGRTKSGLGGLLKAVGGLQGGVNKRLKGKGRSQSVAAVRGAGEDDEEPADAGEEPEAPRPDGLSWLESIRIEDSELAGFIEEGGLAP